MITVLAAMMLLASPDARLRPIIPEVPSIVLDVGNRRARRRDAKLSKR